MTPPADMMIMTKRDAFVAEKQFYWTGKPCSHGHQSMRYTSTGGCVQCMRDAGARNTNKGRGVFALTINVHRDDAAAVEAYAEQLRAIRRVGMTPTNLPEGFTLRQAPPPPKPGTIACPVCAYAITHGVPCEVCGTVVGTI